MIVFVTAHSPDNKRPTCILEGVERVTDINDMEYFHCIYTTKQIVWTKCKTCDTVISESDDDTVSSVM